MTPGETIAAVLPFVCLAAAFFRARLVALALAPSCIGIIACIGFGVDASSASHPIRWIVPVSTLVLAGFAVALEMRKPWPSRAVAWAARVPVREFGVRWVWYRQRYRDKRIIITLVLILASTAPDLLALHPLFWAHTREWPLVPLQIALCGTILALLLAPERMVSKWLR